jgi:hypothetical protein
VARRADRRSLSWSLALAVALGISPAAADPLIVSNNAGNLTPGFPFSPIVTYDFATGATIDSFVPDGIVIFSMSGAGVEVVGDEVFYTVIHGGFGSSAIRVTPFNGGAGGSDVRILPNPRPGTGIPALSFSNGVLYALTGFAPFISSVQVFGLDPLTGAVLSGPVTIAATFRYQDGFTVLPNGNFLVNTGNVSCTYNEYDPVTGALIPGTTLVVPGARRCIGVDTDGVSLFFATHADFSAPAKDSFIHTDLAGNFISETVLAPNLNFDISLVHTLNQPPDCTYAAANPGVLWAPDHALVPITIDGVMDPDDDPLTITPSSVTQDEEANAGGIGQRNASPDATLNPLTVRRERNGTEKTLGNGRVYHISFTAADGTGATCSGTVNVCVPHDQRPGAICVDNGPLYDSTVP